MRVQDLKDILDRFEPSYEVVVDGLYLTDDITLKHDYQHYQPGEQVRTTLYLRRSNRYQSRRLS